MEYSALQLFGLLVRLCFELTLPIIAVVYIYKKYRCGIYPAIIGFAALNLIVLPRALLNNIFLSDGSFWVGQIVTTALIGATCEETGRFIAMKFTMPNHDTAADAMCYGAGHSLMETLPMTFNYTLSFIATGITLLSGASAENADIVMSMGFIDIASPIVDVAQALALHLSCSVLVCMSVHYSQCRRFLPIAIAVHAGANILKYFFGTWAGLILVTILCIKTYKTVKNSNMPLCH